MNDPELMRMVERFGGLDAELRHESVKFPRPLGAERGKSSGDGVSRVRNLEFGVGSFGRIVIWRMLRHSALRIPRSAFATPAVS